MDGDIAPLLNTYTTIILMICFLLLAISVVLPLFALLVIPVGISYYCLQVWSVADCSPLPWRQSDSLQLVAPQCLSLQRYYRGASLELQRLADVLRSPVYQHFSESLHGLQTIRSFGMLRQYQGILDDRLNMSHRGYLSSEMAFVWLAVRLGVLGAAVVGFTTASVIIFADTVPAGLAGLAMSYAFQAFGVFSFAVMLSTWLEIRMNSVDRILEYTNVSTVASHAAPGGRVTKL